MNRPVIGISLNFLPLAKKGLTHYLSEKYLRAVLDAGGLPVLLPSSPGMTELVGQVLESVDGLLLTGGGDLAPQLFNGKRHPQVYGVSVDRDAFEIQAVRAAITKRLPILGICRGCQALNVALGGSLFTHITTQKLNALIHDQNESEPRDRFSHTVKIEKTSLLADILGSLTVQVNSLHHQGIDKIGEGLHITARAPDGLVEAVEIDNYPFGVAVQWHPEWLHAYPEQRRLFEAYIHAAEVYHQGRRKAVRYDQTHRCF